VAAGPDAGRPAASLSPAPHARTQSAQLTSGRTPPTLNIAPNATTPSPPGETLKLLVIAALSAAAWATPTAAAQNVSAPTPDPAPPPDTAPVQPTPDPVPAPQPASSAPSDAPAPETQAPPPEPVSAPAPAPAEPESAPAPAPAPAAQAAASDPPSDRGRADARRGGDGGKGHPGERDRSTPVDAAKPLPVLPGIGPLVEGFRARAADAGPPIAIAALALLTLALTSGAFLMIATRRTRAWRTW
jgi:hypothetical protein